MDRLIALVALRWRLDARAVAGSRGRLALLLVALPPLLLVSAMSAFVAFAGARFLGRAEPELLLAAVSGLATLFGVGWALAPLLAGIAATETHDMGKLLSYPVSLPVLVVSSLVANLLQPVVLAQAPPLVALALGLGGALCILGGRRVGHNARVGRREGGLQISALQVHRQQVELGNGGESGPFVARANRATRCGCKQSRLLG